MTNNTQPEALRLAEQYDYGDPVAHSNMWKAAVCNALRRQHDRIAELEAVGAGGVQALSAAPEMECPSREKLRDMRHYLVEAHGFAAMSPRGKENIAWALEILDELEHLASFHSAPKAAPGGKDTEKEKSNARLDTDSNFTAPEQQRDVACSLAMGQQVGNGEHQEASCRGSKDSEQLKIAARNLKYFIEHAQFSSFADKRAALNCLDALAAPQQEAQEPSHRETVDVVGVRSSSEHVNLGKIAMPPRMKAREITIEQFGSFKDDDGSDAEMCFGALEYFLEWLIQQGWSKAPQPAPAPLIARSLAEWHEDDGCVAWWAWNGREWAGEPAWIGNPNCEDWPGYHTHWTPHPDQPVFSALAAQGGKV